MDTIPYDDMLNRALQGVLHDVLAQVEKTGLPGKHHLVITFYTKTKGMGIPDILLDEYPEHMTIVLQHKFWDLKVNEQGFEVSLSFNKNMEHLVVPFEAVISLYDPSVQYGLHLLAEKPKHIEKPEPVVQVDHINVVNLDDFRKR